MHVLLISGSTRAGSSNTRVLRKMDRLDHPGVTTELYGGMTGLPAFVPDADPLPPAVTELLLLIENADAVVFSTPEYAGALPGTLKNLLDWTVGGGQLYQKLVAWLDVAAPGRGAGARAQLRSVLGYVGARISEAACVHVALDPAAEAATITSAEAQQLSGALAALVVASQEDTEA